MGNLWADRDKHIRKMFLDLLDRYKPKLGQATGVLPGRNLPAPGGSSDPGGGTRGGVVLSDDDPADIGSTDAGGASTASRGDHVHALPASGVTPGTYGDATHVAQITVDAEGRVTDATDVTITGGGGLGGITVSGTPAAGEVLTATSSSAATWAVVCARGTLLGLPSPGEPGRLYYVTTLGTLYRDNGTGWEEVGFTNPMSAEGDLIVGAGTLPALGNATRLPVGSDGDVLTVVSGTPAWAAPSGGGGGGGAPSHAYYDKLAALLEPDCIEPLLRDTFSYSVSGSATKYLIASWQTRIGGSGRMEVRDPHTPMPLRGVTLNGIDTNSAAAILDPSLATYDDSWTTYYDRLNTLAETTPKVLNLTSTSQIVPFLPGPYGAIILRAVNFGFSWIIFLHQKVIGFNLGNEVSDSTTQRLDTALTLPISKLICSEAQSDDNGEGGSPSAAASIVYVLLDADWSAIPDTTSYDFRDDFMGTSLDTTTDWTRAQSTTGNVEINTDFAWLKMVGNSSWGANGCYSQSSISRASGKVFLCDVYMGRGGDPDIMVGFSDGGGQSYTNFAHGVLLNGNSGGGQIQIFENGTNRSTISGKPIANGGGTYRVRITLGSGGAATYELQGGASDPPIGDSSWTDITPGTTSSATTDLHAAATAYSGTCYVGDVRMY